MWYQNDIIFVYMYIYVNLKNFDKILKLRKNRDNSFKNIYCTHDIDVNRNLTDHPVVPHVASMLAAFTITLTVCMILHKI